MVWICISDIMSLSQGSTSPCRSVSLRRGLLVKTAEPKVSFLPLRQIVFGQIWGSRGSTSGPRNIPSAISPNIKPVFRLVFFQRESQSRESDMARFYFHYSNSEGVCIDQRGTAVGNLA